MRRYGRGNQPDLIQAQRLAAALGQQQMAVVDWVEGAAVEAETHGVEGSGFRVQGRNYAVGVSFFSGVCVEPKYSYRKDLRSKFAGIRYALYAYYAGRQ